jgi:hypothetical protein
MVDGNKTRRLRFFLRDFRMVEAHVALADGQSLASCLTHRKAYINLQAALWQSTGERVDHAVLKIEQVLWAAAPDGDVPLVNAAFPLRPRAVDLQLEGGLLLRAGLNTGDRQRLGDYLESAGVFVPLREAVLLRSGRPPRRANVTLGDIVVNQLAIQSMWELSSNTAELAGESGGVSLPSGLEDLDAHSIG